MIEHNVFLAVVDGRYAYIYRNSGTAQAPHLELISGFEQKNPPSREQGTDKPGTNFSGPGGVRSHVSESDYHAEQERQFAKDVIRSLDILRRDRNISKLILVAPPRMLAELRRDITHQLKEIVIREIDKDLTKHTPQEIVKLISS